MCRICLSTPCLGRCPNAPEPLPLLLCMKCGYGIHEGEQYIDGADGAVCRECLDEMTTEEWLEMMGEPLLTAEEKEEERWRAISYR